MKQMQPEDNCGNCKYTNPDHPDFIDTRDKNCTKEQLEEWIKWTFFMMNKAEKDGYFSVLCKSCFEAFNSEVLSSRAEEGRYNAPDYMTDSEIEDLGFDRND